MVLEQFGDGGEGESGTLLKAADVTAGELVEIVSFQMTKLDRETKPSVTLTGERWTRTLILNRRNGRTLAAMARKRGGEEQLLGVSVHLGLEPVEFQGKTVSSVVVVPR